MTIPSPSQDQPPSLPRGCRLSNQAVEALHVMSQARCRRMPNLPTEQTLLLTVRDTWVIRKQPRTVHQTSTTLRPRKKGLPPSCDLAQTSGRSNKRTWQSKLNYRVKNGLSQKPSGKKEYMLIHHLVQRLSTAGPTRRADWEMLLIVHRLQATSVTDAAKKVGSYIPLSTCAHC